MGNARRLGLVVALALGGGTLLAQGLPNPYRIVEGWAKLPNGRKMGAVGKVGIAPGGGTHIWAVIRCDYVADSESDDVQNPGWEMGIRIGDARTGWVNAFIPYPWGDPRITAGNGAEFVAVDKDGNVYGGEPSPKRLQKYVRVRP